MSAFPSLCSYSAWLDWHVFFGHVLDNTVATRAHVLDPVLQAHIVAFV